MPIFVPVNKLAIQEQSKRRGKKIVASSQMSCSYVMLGEVLRGRVKVISSALSGRRSHRFQYDFSGNCVIHLFDTPASCLAKAWLGHDLVMHDIFIKMEVGWWAHKTNETTSPILYSLVIYGGLDKRSFQLRADKI